MTTKTNTERNAELRSARQVLDDLTAKRERLPRAICSVCGGIVAAGTGHSNGEPDVAWSRLDTERKRAMRPPLAGWTRRHDACCDDAYVVRKTTGLRVPDDVARAAVSVAHPAIIDHPLAAVNAVFASYRSGRTVEVTGWPGRAWAHLTREYRDRFAEIVNAELREHQLRSIPHRCADGPCGACGVALSLSWTESRMTWKDGTPAPYCRDCAEVAGARLETDDLMRLREIALEALSSASGMGMDEAFGPNMRMFCELVEPGHVGTGERWQHASDAWGEIRETVRLAVPWSLPDLAMREHYQALRFAAAKAAEARGKQEREQEERAELQQAGWTA